MAKLLIKFVKIIFYVSVFISSYNTIHAQTAQDYIESGKNKCEIGVYSEAIEDFTNAIQLNQLSEDAFYHRGVAHYHIGRYNAALQDFNKAIELEPKQAMSYYKRGLTHHQLKDHQVALWDFNKAIQLSPNYEHTYVARAKTYKELHRYLQAINDCNQALQFVPNFAEALSLRGLIQLDQGKLRDALVDLKSAIQNAPNKPHYHTNLGLYYQATNQAERAIEEYTAAITLDPNNYEAYCNRAILKLSLNNNSEAQKDANKAIYNNRRFYKAYIIRGIANYNLDEYHRFEYDFNSYLKKATTGKDFHFIASMVNQYGKDDKILEKAEKWAKKATQQQNNYENNQLHAEILFKLNKTTLAKETAEKAVVLAKKENIDSGNSTTLISQIDKEKLDKKPPVIHITSPVAAVRGVILVEAAEKITVIGQATDESGVTKVLINGNPARLKNDGSFDGITVLKSTENLINIEAIDTRGNISKKSFVVKKQAKEKGQLAKTPIGGKKLALLFATNQYESWGDLINPINDARAIGQDLKEIYGFDVEVMENLSKEDVMLKIKSYAKKQYENNDQLFVFFAGHGQFDEIFKEGYVVAKDSRFDDESKSSYISHSNLRTYINSIPCKHIFLVMDVCFGGTIDRNLAMARGEESNFDKDREEFINRKLRYTTRRFLTSGGKEYVPDGRPGKHSPFVRSLLEALRNEGGKDKILTISEIINSVSGITPQPHTGEFGNNEPGGDFLFITR